MEHEKVYMLTDGCMWEINQQTGNEHPHAVEVVDLETGAVRYITSGSRITFIKGKITDIRTQKVYNKTVKKMSNNGQTMPKRARSEGKDEPIQTTETTGL